MKHVIILCGVLASLLAAGATDQLRPLDQAIQKLLALPPMSESLLPNYVAAKAVVERLGSEDEIRAALWKILDDETQVSERRRAFEELYHYKVPVKDRAAWVRRNLDGLLLGDKALLSDALVVLGQAIKESDAQLLRDAAGRLPAGNETEKKSLLAIAEDVPERIRFRLEGEAYTREMDERVARGDRSPEVLHWIKRKEDDQKALEIEQKFKKAIMAGTSFEEAYKAARKAALEGSSPKPSEPPQPGKSSSSSEGVPSKKSQTSAPAQVESLGQSKPNSTDSAHETSSQGWLPWLVLIFAAAIGAAWLFLRKGSDRGHG